jgi:prevent-host-death family protein
MKQSHLSTDLVPVNEFRSNMASVLKQVADSGRPVVLTQRGRAAAVLLEPSMYDAFEESVEVVRRVARALEDVRAGRTSDNEEVWDEIATLLDPPT